MKTANACVSALQIFSYAIVLIGTACAMNPGYLNLVPSGWQKCRIEEMKIEIEVPIYAAGTCSEFPPAFYAWSLDDSSEGSVHIFTRPLKYQFEETCQIEVLITLGESSNQHLLMLHHLPYQWDRAEMQKQLEQRKCEFMKRTQGSQGPQIEKLRVLRNGTHILLVYGVYRIGPYVETTIQRQDLEIMDRILMSVKPVQ